MINDFTAKKIKKGHFLIITKIMIKVISAILPY